MDDKNSREFDDLDELISYYSRSNSTPKSKNDDLSFNKESIQRAGNSKKKFVVHIDDDNLDYSTEKSRPSDSSSVYFSNYPKKKSQSKDGNYNNTARQSTQNKQNKATVKKKSVGSRLAVILFACIIFFTSISSYVIISGINDILAINTSDVVDSVNIPEGSDYSDIIDILNENDLIKIKSFSKMFAKFRGFDEYTYLSGVYYLDRSMGVEGMLNECRAAPESAETVTLGFPEGWTITQIFEKLNKYEVCRSDRMYTALTQVDYEFDFVRSIPDSEERYQKFEGYLFPDTYDFYVDADANYVIRKFLSNFNDHWTEKHQKRADALNLTMDEVITIASIVQKEAANAKQMKIVSSVIHNRLKNSVAFPTLGCDATSVYISNYVTKIVGGVKGSFYLSNYDTSAIKGLPPGPICNPGMDAIEAALYPDDTGYYFFLHDNSGKIYLAKTQKEHESNYVKAIKANNSNG